MITVAQSVEDIVISTPFLSDALAKGLVNASGFARMYKQDIEDTTMKKVTEGSIIMALKRLMKKKQRAPKVTNVFEGIPDIIVRSNLFELTVENKPELLHKQRKILDYSTETPTSLVTITHGVFETTIIGSRNLMQKIRKLYDEKSIISTVENISAITIKFPKNILYTPGVIYTILNLLTWKGINLVEVVSTYSELTLIIEQKDVDRVFSLTQKLFSTKQNIN